MRRVIAILLLLSGSRLLCAQEAGSHEIPEKLLEMITSTAESSGGEVNECGVEEVLEYYRDLLDHPLNVNHAGRDDLARLSILGSWQIESIIAYRAEYGDLLSLNELFNIPGLDGKVISVLLPFLTVEKKSSSSFPPLSSLIKDARGQLLLKGKSIIEKQVGYTSITKNEFEKKPDSRYLGPRGLLYSQVKYESSDRIKCALTFERDPGERGLDYKSINLALYKVGHLDRLMAGDFTARFGQGLVLWNSFSMNSYTEVKTIYKPEIGISPYNSTDENQSLRGVAATLEFSRLRVTLLASKRSYDARVVDGEYTSLLTTGLHNTTTTLGRKGALGAALLGSNISYAGRNFRVSQTSAIFRYSLPYGGRDSVFLARDVAMDGYQGNFSLEGYWVMQHFRLFGEAAADHMGSYAAIAGLLYSPGSRFETGLLLRDYSQDYRAPFAGPISRGSSIGGERGARLSAVFYLGKYCRASASAEFLEDYHNLTLTASRIKEEISSAELRYVNTEGRHSLRYTHTLRVSSRFRIAGRADYNTVKGAKNGKGYHIAAEVIYKALSKRCDASMRIACFNTPLWDTRIYSYERDMLYNFSVPFYYGSGVRWYINIHVVPARRFDLWLRISQTRYLDRDYIGEGTEYISSPCKSELKLQLRFRL